MDVEINAVWSRFHFPTAYSNNSNDEDSDHDDDDLNANESYFEEDICSECENHPALSWSPLCSYCDDYFGGLDGLARYNRDLALERGCFF